MLPTADAVSIKRPVYAICAMPHQQEATMAQYRDPLDQPCFRAHV